ncbi:hypothetical protein EGN73_06665 [Arthrospiribacter ruber]|uniref:DAC domain-containing protein n=2 Tax=Arthrospiribacter ruber TaxID=2487934 RepID=A0A951IU64_9BACT|nr:hypothetical protein [Arthrospiribacter ruber]
MEIGDLKNFSNFKRDALGILINHLEDFISAEITCYLYPIKQLKKQYNIVIEENPKRGVYQLDENNVIIIPKVYHNKDIIARIAFSIKKPNVSIDKKIFNVLEGAISKNLSRAYIFGFRETIQYFDDGLIEKVIANYFSKGYYNPSRIIYLLNYFHKLRTTSFEGQFFSTGMILTRAGHAFGEKHNQNRSGKAHALISQQELEGHSIERRFWFMVDGKQSYFLCNRSMTITHLFNLTAEKESEFNYINSLTLSKTLKGGDVLLRIESEKELSVITSEGIEFIYQENKWKYRNYNYIEKLIKSNISFNESSYNHLIFYILYCSKHGISSIIWIPEDLQDVNIILKTKNRLFRNDINVDNRDYSNLIIRFLSSDGATIIDSNGNICYYGCIADLSKTKIKGVQGTGENAAGALSCNGISIKISQDGTIKLYLSPSCKIII